MTRKVLPLANVAHRWAHQLQDEARTVSNSLHFEGRCIYSYNRCIGVILEPTTVFLDKTKCSITTASHQSLVESSVSHLHRIYTTTRITLGRECDRTDYLSWLKTELKACREGLEALIESAPRKRSRHTKTRTLRDIVTTQSNLRNLIEFSETFFGTLPSGWRPEMELGFEELLTSARELTVFPAHLEPLREAVLALIEEENKAFTARLEVDTVAWKDNTKDAPAWVCGSLLAYLRVNGAHLETSKGIRIPLEEARILFAAFDKGKLLGKEVQGFRITQVDSNLKQIVAGCHTIPFEELERVRAELFPVSSPLLEECAS